MSENDAAPDCISSSPRAKHYVGSKSRQPSLGSKGERLKAGQIVMTGSIMKTIFPVEDAVFGFALDGIGDVSVIVR
jgi:hypothetical protein